jgi:hypothetical protein
MKAAWLFHGGSGSVIHDYVAGNDAFPETGLLENRPTPYGDCYYFEGSSTVRYQTSATNPGNDGYVDYNTPFTIVTMVQLENPPADTFNAVFSLKGKPGVDNYHLTFGTGSSYPPFWTGNNSSWRYLRPNTGEAKSAYYGRWVHIVITYRGLTGGHTGGASNNNFRFYIDGQWTELNALATQVVPFNGETTFGAHLTASTWDYDGFIDHVYFYDQVMSDIDIQRLYNQPYDMFINGDTDPSEELIIYGANAAPVAGGGKKDKIIGGNF